jgi:probable O-glycosylation ligase (exosortase A-associated)
MRFAVYAAILLAILPVVLIRPFFGLCVYYVVSLMQPKLLCWRPEFQDALLVGVPLMIGAIVIGVRRRQVAVRTDAVSGRVVKTEPRTVAAPLFEFAWPLALFAALVLYIAATRLLAPYPLTDTSYQFRSLVKILIVAILVTGMASDVKRIRILYAVVALAVAFWAIKGGLKVILLGPHQVYGKSYDNNLFALTSAMTLPMVFYFGLSLRQGRWRNLLILCAALMCLAIIGSRSRAGFVAFVFVLAGMAWTSRYRLRAMLAVLLVATVALATSAGEIRERIESIIDYRQDRSARSRFWTWQSARQLLAHSPAIGVGFANFETANRDLEGGGKAAHNIYLQNLAELGLLGHPIWLVLILGSLLSMFRYMRRARGLPPDLRWGYHLSRGLCLGMAAYCIHGMFHNEEYLELTFAMIALHIALKVAIARELRQRRLIHDIDRPGASAPQAAATDSPPAARHPAIAFPVMRPFRRPLPNPV